MQEEIKDAESFSLSVGLYIKVYDSDCRNPAFHSLYFTSCFFHSCIFHLCHLLLLFPLLHFPLPHFQLPHLD